MNAPLRRLAGVIALLFALLLASSTWIQVLDAQSLKNKPTNSRTIFAEFGRDRGPLLVGGSPIATSVPSKDAYKFLRTYPGGAAYAHLTGYFSVVYGSTGLESQEGDLLSGTSDQLFYRRLRDLLTGDQPRGASVELTIDPKVQQLAYKELGNREGAVVALDPRTGNVIAMVSRPSYNPNLLAGHDATTVRANRAKLLADPRRPLDDRAIASRLYAPGSTFKLVVSAAALSSGKYTPDSMLKGPAVLPLPQSTKGLPNDEPGGCGPNDQVSLIDALKISCNTAFGGLGMQLGQDAIREQAEKFGFDQQLAIPLKVTPSSYPKNMDQAQTALSSIGQFDDQVTPLQMAMVSAAIANDGVLMRPNLIRDVRTSDFKVIDQPQPEKLSDAVTPDVANQLTQMMETVVESGTGTRAQIDGVKVAGKTGTAQHGDNLPPNAWFTAFAPADDPKVAVAVIVENGGGRGDAATGGRVAAPIAKDVMEAVLGK